MILRVYIDDDGYPVYEEPVDEIDEKILQELLSKKVIKENDVSILEIV